jgi:hypothetical protein
MREGNSNTKVGNFHPPEWNDEPKQGIFDSSEGSLIGSEETKRSRRGTSISPGKSCIPGGERDFLHIHPAFLREWDTGCFSEL